GDASPSISPDGKQLVFIRSFANYNEDLMVADLRDGATAGPPRRLTSDHQNKASPVWTEDGKEIVYIAGENLSLLGVYRVRASGGAPRRAEIRGGGENVASLAIAARGHRLAYGRAFRDYNTYRMRLPDGGGTAGIPERFLSSTRFEEGPTYSPDG